VADDLGWGDLSSYGSPTIRTPNLDRLAREGMRLTQFTVPASVCAPSRAAIMTGRYPVRTGIFWNPPHELRPAERTVAEYLKDPGYVTGAVGKWHLGLAADDVPVFHGFDFYYGIPYGEDGNDFYFGASVTSDGVGLGDLAHKYTMEAEDFIEGAGSRPFFLYLAHRSPHTPLYASSAFLGRSAGGLYGDVVEELDANVGELLDFLHERGLDKNTLVFFTSDNGPSRQGGVFGSAGPFLGGKASCLEGGLRVPGLAWWPGRIPAGQVSDEPTSTLDLLPTFVARAGGTLPGGRAFDGMDLMPLLSGAVQHLSGPGIDGGRELLHYYSADAVSLRSGRYKYLAPGFWDGKLNLFDLQADPGETRNLFDERPELARQMKDRLATLADLVATQAPIPR
jgi:arylsulfatase A-like enzyme